MFNRKLFPNITTATNETDCAEFCDQTCVYGCYSYSVSFYPPSPSNLDQGYHISPFVIIVAVTLASLFLLVSYYAIVVKYCANRRSSEGLPSSARSIAGEEDEYHDRMDQDPVADHPIWFITTVGLQQSIINSITVVRYRKGDGLIEGTECSVCLSEFQEGETLRLLPKCNHAFHIGCIDTWLRSHTNCPLCRAGIVTNSGRQCLPSNDQNFNHSRDPEMTRVAGSGIGDGELGNNFTRTSGVDDNNRVQMGGDAELSRVCVQNKVDVNLNADEINMDGNQQVSEHKLHLLRRSISMDHLRGVNKTYPDLESINSHEMGGSSIAYNMGDQHSNSSLLRLVRSLSSCSRPMQSQIQLRILMDWQGLP
ncbi:hypothetical protein Nepgr_033223 [Nepenthes gracilis]|uniref:RING-type E3 ubiquitin transferase n=1 Tax=Nepenthes gracilis TaxID=150966 RepID=A0AAD3Y880_NEPGR|nr:hypothetical protein Nepgr_033223 [Nepenthes gracilis]